MQEERPFVIAADDNEDILGLVRSRLTKRGYEVEAVPNGQEALDAVARRRPDAIILDWMMPEVEGREVCARIKADPSTSDIPVIMLTARAAEGDVSEGFGSGADEYLTKPFEIEELHETLQRLLKTKH